MCCSQAHHECPLLLGSLEAAMAELGCGVDEFELDGLLGLARRVHEHRLGGGGGHKDVHTQYTSCNNAFNCESKCCYFFTYPANCL